MRAVVCDRYGPSDVLRITEVPRPVPGPDEVLIRILALMGLRRADIRKGRSIGNVVLTVS